MRGWFTLHNLTEVMKFCTRQVFTSTLKPMCYLVAIVEEDTVEEVQCQPTPYSAGLGSCANYNKDLGQHLLFVHSTRKWSPVFLNIPMSTQCFSFHWFHNVNPTGTVYRSIFKQGLDCSHGGYQHCTLSLDTHSFFRSCRHTATYV